MKVENVNLLFWWYIHLKTSWHSWFSCYICPRPWCVYCKWYLFKLSSNLLHQPLTEFGVTWLVLVQPPPFSSHSQPCFVQFLKPQRFNANLWIQFLRNTNNFYTWNTNKSAVENIDKEKSENFTKNFKQYEDIESNFRLR